MIKPAILLDPNWQSLKFEEIFGRQLPGYEIVNWENISQRPDDLSQVKYALVWAPEPGLLASCANLEVIFSVGAGVNHILADSQLPDCPIVRFVDQRLTGPMVEWVVLQVLLHMRQQRQYDALQRQHVWRELEQPAATRFRVGIMGFGELGRAAGRVLGSLGFQLNSWSQSPKNVAGVRSFHGDTQLAAFLGATDILVSLLPLTDSTRGLLNTELIDALARDGPFGAPILINAGRGGSQVEDDIVEALRDGRLRGASLDVFETEPLPQSSLLWDMENLVITPHAAAVSDPLALAEHVVGQIERFERGEPLEHVVDRQRGY